MNKCRREWKVTTKEGKWLVNGVDAALRAVKTPVHSYTVLQERHFGKFERVGEAQRMGPNEMLLSRL
jgi:hypothetical protein